MAQTTGEKQNDQYQQEQPKKGAVSRGINSINGLARARKILSNPFNKIGSRLVLQTGRSLTLFLASNPWAWAILAILIVAIATFAIVMGFGGAPPPPIETITPTPAVP